MRAIAPITAALILAGTAPLVHAQDDSFPGTGSMQDWKTAQPEAKQGWALLRQNRYDQAIAKFRAASALYPNRADCYLGIGEALEGKNADPKDIEEAYRHAIKLDS